MKKSIFGLALLASIQVLEVVSSGQDEWAGYCQLPDCEVCSDLSTCEECRAGYSNSGSSCEVCSYSIENCKVCPDLEENVVRNGGFEDPVLDKTRRIDESEVPGWKDKDLDKINIIRASYVSEGDQCLELVHNWDGKVYQILKDLEEGATYLFSYMYAGRDPEENTVRAYWDNILLATMNFQETPIKWTLYQFEVVAASSRVTIKFKSLNGSENTKGGMIDDVRLQKITGCSQCETGYFSEGIQCKSCAQFGDMCYTCTASGCSQCLNGYFADHTGNCMTCNQLYPHCLLCNPEGTECSVCEDGYKIFDEYCIYDNKYCEAQGCDTFTDDTELYCEDCSDGYVKINFHCYPAIDNCVKYADDGQCIDCEDELMPYRNRCI